MRTGNLRLTALLAAAVTVVAIGSAIAAEGDGDGDTLQVGGQDEELAAALLALEPSLPDPLPTGATLAGDGIDVVLAGSFTSSRTALDAVEDDLRALFIAADAAGSAAGDAIADVTRGLLIERQGLLVLEELDDASDPRPLDSSDARDTREIAIDADGLLGATVTGLDILLSGRDLQRAGYEVLRGLPATVDENGVFDARFEELVAHRDTVEVALRAVVSEPTAQLLVPVVRFDAPLGVAHAVGVTYVCVDREAYIALADAPETERLAGSVAAVPDAGCVEAARRAGLTLADQVATDALLDGVETAVGSGGVVADDTDS